MSRCANRKRRFERPESLLHPLAWPPDVQPLFAPGDPAAACRPPRRDSGALGIVGLACPQRGAKIARLRRVVARSLALVLVALPGICAAARAENVDLSTVPDRASVQLTIYNSEDLTLVRETRTVSFKQGSNPLQFSWANTLIDPTSVELRFLSAADKLEVLDTTFPHDKPQMLYWNVRSEFDGEATIEIKYFTSGITWTADYLCIADAAEERMSFEGFVRVHNNSGEAYENAQIRLVVGTLNLVEKIARLARVPEADVGRLGEETRRDYRFKAARKSLDKADANGVFFDADKKAEAKQITKEGLSEYFIFAIEGTETIPNGWSKRLRSFEGRQAPFRVEYRYRPAEYGEQLVRMYLLANDEASQLGTAPLPDGAVRLFRDNGRDGLSFLAAQSIKYVPIGDKIELNLGADPQVVFELVPRRTWRDQLWVQITGTDTFRRVEDGKLVLDERARVAGWDEHVLFEQRIRNYSRRPIDVEVRRQFPGHVRFRAALAVKLHDYQTVQYTARVPAGQTARLPYEVVTSNGRNARQNNVTLVEAAPQPGG